MQHMVSLVQLGVGLEEWALVVCCTATASSCTTHHQRTLLKTDT